MPLYGLISYLPTVGVIVSPNYPAYNICSLNECMERTRAVNTTTIVTSDGVAQNSRVVC